MRREDHIVNSVVGSNRAYSTSSSETTGLIPLRRRKQPGLFHFVVGNNRAYSTSSSETTGLIPLRCLAPLRLITLCFDAFASRSYHCRGAMQRSGISPNARAPYRPGRFKEITTRLSSPSPMLSVLISLLSARAMCTIRRSLGGIASRATERL
jgi:hypothetical protein